MWLLAGEFPEETYGIDRQPFGYRQQQGVVLRCVDPAKTRKVTRCSAPCSRRTDQPFLTRKVVLSVPFSPQPQMCYMKTARTDG